MLIHGSRRLIRDLVSGPPFRLVLLAYVVAPLVLTFGLIWFLTLVQFESVSERRMQEEIDLVARAMQLPLSHALDQGRIDRLKQSLDSTLSIDRVYGAYVYNNDGELVLAAGHGAEPRRPEIREIAVEGDRRGEYGEMSGRRVYSSFVPLGDIGGRVNGVLQVTRHRRDFDKYLSQLRGLALMSLGLGSGLMVGLMLWGHHHALGKHIQRLSQDMQLVGHGQRHRAALEGPKELRTLATSLNAMLDSIALSGEKLREQQRVQTSLEDRLRQAEKLAAIGGLAAGIAHELGTPLSIIDGHAQRVSREPRLPGTSARAVTLIREQVRRMEWLVRELLDFSGRRTTRRRTGKLSEVVTRVCQSLDGLAETYSVTLRIEIDRREITTPLDMDGLERALTNLVRNGIQAAAGGEVVVCTCVDEEDGVYRVQVDDSGSGVAPEIRDRIFEPFFTTKPVGKGTGLGLALAYRAVQDMGGRIDVLSSDKGGARFEIRLPLNGRDEKDVSA